MEASMMELLVSSFGNAAALCPGSTSQECSSCLDPSDGPCPYHTIRVEDKKIFCMSVASLPEGLYIREVPRFAEKCVMAATGIKRNTVYGPLIGILIKSRDSGKKSQFAVGSKESGWLDYWLDSDDVCNWMKHVRLARHTGEQNLVAYQQNQEIYFATTREISVGEELKVWYSKGYGQDLGYGALPTGEPKRIRPPDGGRQKKYQSRFRFRCDVCTDAYRVEVLLALHKNSHGVELSHELKAMAACPSCDVTFSSSELLIAHVRRHRQPAQKAEPYKCCKCIKTFSTTKGLAAHIKISHSENGAEARKMLECDVCHKKVQSGAAFFAHWKSHQGDDPYNCPVCLQAFKNPIELHRHSETHCVDGEFPCRMCPKKFEKFSSLGTHLRKFHRGEKKLVCSVCGLNFATKHNLKVHMLVHFPKFDFQCEHCGQQFKHSHNYTRHVDRLHNPNKPPTQKHRKVRIFDGMNLPRSSRDYMSYTYKCMDCKLGFYQKRFYMKHLEKLHPDTDFNSIPELLLPMTPVEMFPCELCRKNFYSKAGLETHVEKEHADCNLTEYREGTSKVNDTLQRKTAMLYVCTVCDVKLISAAKLVKHTKTRHPEVDLLDGITAQQHLIFG